MKTFKQILIYILVAAVASCLTLAITLRGGMREYDKLDEIRQIVDTYFIGQVDADAVADGAAAGMIGALDDRWSHYMNAEEYKAYKETMNNAYVGIGVTITVREDGYIDILQVNEGGPAEKAGVLPGDMIVAVSGQDISSMDLDTVKGMIRGVEGTKVSVTVRRDGTDRELQITRKSIETVVAKAQMLDGQIGLITIVNFDKRCAQETIGHIESLVSQGAKALIFDVRYNPGGYKDELVKVLDYLLPEGDLFVSEDYTGVKQTDTSNPSCLRMPMAVLINAYSYSSAEFFAAVLEEYEWAFTVGEHTVGKGNYQITIPLSDGSAVSLSVGRYYTPIKGIWLEESGGLAPTIEVEVDEETLAYIYAGLLDPMKDPQVLAALEALK